MITLDVLSCLGGIRHGFFTRRGGVSEGIYSSLNCGYGSDDQPERVRENRARVANRLGFAAEQLVTLYQVHSPGVVVVERPWSPAEAPEADAMVSRTPGLALGILTADCVPVLLADAEAGVIGAAHAGWKGAQTGVLDAVVAAMAALGAVRERLVSAIGPCIAQRSYEVGPEFPGHFTAADRDFFVPAPRAGHHLFDLGGLVERRLAALGVGRIARAPHDTASESEQFFSYRRATLQKEPGYGRGISVIALV